MKHFKAFNPEHDLALANGDRHFIAPKNIREMALDLAPLMDFIDSDGILVWGWDYAIKRQLQHIGIDTKLLPTDAALTALRNCSGRQSAHHLLKAFRTAHPTGPYTGESLIIRDISEIAPYAALHNHIVLKDPLSSSGKGLRHVVHDTKWDKICEWAEALIRRHGYLTAEPYYDKVQDFAMEFQIAGGQCRFIGYSLFSTNHHGRYESNLLMADEKIEFLLSRYVPQAALQEVRAWGIGHSSHIIPPEWDTTQHPLYFGIDMMVVREADNTYAIHPCVEINLRLNMGIVAHEVRCKLLVPNTEGTFHVTAFPTEEALRDFHDEQIKKHPPVCREGKIVSGYHPLTPIHPHTHHLAYIQCGSVAYTTYQQEKTP